MVGAGLVRVPGLGIHGGDHPLRGHLPGDAPASVGAIGALGGFDVLPGDQRQQPDRLGRGRVEFLLGQVSQQPVRVRDQGIHQLFASVGVVPGNRRLPRQGVVVPGAPRGDHLPGAGHHPGHPADRCDQLGDRVLGGHRVIEHRGVQRPASLPGQHPGLGHHLPDHIEDPSRSL